MNSQYFCMVYLAMNEYSQVPHLTCYFYKLVGEADQELSGYFRADESESRPRCAAAAWS